MGWKGCSAQGRAAVSSGYSSSTSVSTALLLPPPLGHLQVLQQRPLLHLPTFPAWSRLETPSLEQAAVCTPNLLPALPHHLQALSDLPKAQHKSPLPAALLSPEAHPCGSSLDSEALALKRSERHLTPRQLPGEDSSCIPDALPALVMLNLRPCVLL